MSRRAIWLALGVGLATGWGTTAWAGETWTDGEPLSVTDITELDLEDLLAAPVVESAARRKQSIGDAPAAMEVFSAEEISRAGILSLADILRRVPGMFVVQTNANQFDVGMRGVFSLGNNRILVLLNGQRLMELDHESPAWSTLPVHVGEIETIEVLRGPGSIVYGADALSGVINISTKRPLDHHGFGALFAAGNGLVASPPGAYEARRVNSLGSGYVSYTTHSRSEKVGATVTLGANQIPDWVAPAPASVAHYGNYGFHAGATLEWRRDARTNLLIDLRDSHGESQHTTQNLTDAPFVDSNMQSILARFRKEKLTEHTTLTIDTVHQRRLETSRQLVVRDILAPVSADNPLEVLTTMERVNYRGQVLAQLDIDVPQLRTVFSLGTESSRQFTTQIEAGDYTQIYTAGLAQSETRLFHRPELLLNLGLRAERVAVSAPEKGNAHYARLSPRGSLIVKLAPEHTVRVAVASAYRMPALGEISNVAFASPLSQNRGDTPQVYTIWGNFSLKPEQARSLEVGYRGRPARWLRLDGTVYGQEIIDPVRILRQQMPLTYENAGRQWQVGTEVGIRVQPMAAFGMHAAYAWTRTHDTGADGPTGDFPAHLAQIGIDAHAREVRLNLDFAYASTIDPLPMQRTSIGPQFTHLPSNSQRLLNLRVGKRIFDNRVEIFAQGSNLLSPFFSRAALGQYPVGGASPIGMVVLAGVRVRETGRGDTP